MNNLCIINKNIVYSIFYIFIFINHIINEKIKAEKVFDYASLYHEKKDLKIGVDNHNKALSLNT